MDSGLMDFRIQLPNEARVSATFNPADPQGFIETQTIMELRTFGNPRTELQRNWEIFMTCAEDLDGYGCREIQGGRSTLIRDDDEEFFVGFNCHEFRVIESGKTFRFSIGGEGGEAIISFMRTQPTIRTKRA
jgi:hypothetical protein